MSDLARAFLDHMMFVDRIVVPPPGVGAQGSHRQPAGRPVTGAKEPPGAASSPRRGLAAKHRARKGRELQLKARDYFRAQGFQVEVAQNKILWIPGPSGKRIPISRRNDYFGLWDLIVVGPKTRFLVQVTVLSEVSVKRAAILASGFPTTAEDCILGHERGRVFRVLRGPLFATGEERVEVPR